MMVQQSRILSGTNDSQQAETQRARRLEAIQTVSTAISSTLTIDNILKETCQAAVELFEVDHSGLVIFDENLLQGRVAAEYPPLGKTQGTHIPVQGIPAEERLIASKQPLAIENVAGDDTLGAVKDILLSFDIQSILFVPIVFQERILGSFSLDAVGQTRTFTLEEIELCQNFASQVAVAIANAELIEQLSLQKEHRDRLIANSPNGVVASDRHGRITVYNEQAQAIMGYKPEEVIGQSITRLYADAEEPRRVGKLLHEQNGKLRNYETAVRSQDGELIPIRLAATWLYDSQGERVGAVGYFEDLRVIKETRQRLSLLLKASNVVAQAGNLSTGLQHLAQMMVASLDMKFCLILILDESRQFLVSEAIAPRTNTTGDRSQWPSLGRKIAIANGDGLNEFLAEGGATVLRAGDKWQQQLLVKLPLHLGLLEEEIQSVLALPLRTGERSVGLLYLGESRRWQSVPFSNDKLELAMAIADQTAVLIDHNQLHETTRRRERLLATLDEMSRHIRGEKETRKLWQEIVRLAAELIQCTVGGLFLNQPHLEEVVLIAAHGLPLELMESRLPHGPGLIGRVAATGQALVTNEYGRWPKPDKTLATLNLQTVAAVPLRRAGEVEAVLFVADTSSRHWVTETDLEVLERFAVQATIALQTSRLMGSEQRMFAQLAILHRISDYIQGTDDLQKILHVVLTGVTAGYGLGFNRACLLLLDETGQWLIGSMGIGHLEQELAAESWERDHRQGLYDFGIYLEALENGELPLTPIGKRILTVRHPLQSPKKDAFTRVIREGQWLRFEPEQFRQLPPAFIEMFGPVSSLVIAPLMVRDEAIGLLVADNKFTWSPITDGDVELLLTFANTATVAIDRTRLFHEAQAGRDRIRSLYAASDALILTQGAPKVLLDRIEQARQATSAAGVGVILIDELGQVQDFFSTGLDLPADLSDFVEPDEFSLQVMRSGRPKIMSDTAVFSGQAQPHAFWQQAGAALCVPLAVSNNSIGVIWVCYDQARHFSETDVDALQLYANQTAVAYDSARHINEVEHMRQAAESLAGVSELPKVLEQIVQSAREVLQADVASIYSYDSFRGRFIVENSVATGIPLTAWQKMRQDGPRASGTANFVMDNRWVGIKDIADSQQYPFIGKSSRKILSKIGIKSFQGVALIVDDEKLGVLYVSYKRNRSFSQEEREAAQTFANHAALALKKAKLLDRINKAQNTARTVARVTTLENLDRTLESLVAETKNALNCDAVTLYVYNPYRNQLIYPPTMIGVLYPERALRLPGVAEDSFVLTMIAQEKMYIVKNNAEDRYFRGSRFTADEGIKSCVAIPLRVGAESRGVMFVNYRQPHRFPADELDNIELFANQAAVAIHNAQLYEQEQRRTAALQALYNATKAITGSLDLTETLHRILEQAWQLVSYHEKQISYASIWLVEGESKLKLVAAFPSEELSQTQARLGSEIDWRKGKEGRVGIMGKVIQSGKARLVQDVTQDPDYLESHPQTRSALTVPICLDEKVIGIINVEHSDYDAFDDENARTLQSLADQAAIAIQNTQLFNREQKRAAISQALYEAGQALTGSLDINDILQTITEQAWKITGAVGLTAQFSHLILVNGSKLQLVVTHPPEYSAQFQEVVGMIDLEGGERIGVIGRAVKSGEPQFVSDVLQDDDYIAANDAIRSEVAVPIMISSNVMAVINVEHSAVNAFDKDDVQALVLLAAQAAAVIQNARHYREAEVLQNVAASLAGPMELMEALNLVMRAAMELTHTDAGSILFWNAESEYFAPAFTTSPEGKLEIYKTTARSHGGIAREVITRGVPVIVPDMQHLPNVNPTAVKKDRRAFIGVPLFSKSTIIGVLFVSCVEPRHFSEHQVKLLQTLVSQAVVAIIMARRYEELNEELRKAKGLVGARTALAWMGMASNAWRHSIEGDAVNIRNSVTLLRGQVETAVSNPAHLAQINDKLNRIERAAQKVLGKPITPPLSSEDGVEAIIVNDLIQERLRQLWEDEPYQSIDGPFFHLDTTTAVRVWVSPEWLRLALDLLIDNAVDAMQDREIQQLDVTTTLTDANIDIAIKDTGKGIPPEIRAVLFGDPSDQPKRDGHLGRGLLMVQAIVQTYGGDITIGKTGPEGTTMVLSLPILQET